ncbi:MAG: xylan 1,4-beta-xylosidase [Ponticaulis sp.]|nr:xylan 1,4-beta-xylosidase [Ponticaulis sp.]
MEISRRKALAFMGAGSLAACATTSTKTELLTSTSLTGNQRIWGKGFEGQRIADRGDGTFLNPIFSGDRPDPALLKDGDTYYVSFSTFEAYPGLFIYKSHDLVNWEPIGPSLTTYIGSVWASDLCKHDGRFYRYIPARTDERKSIYVIYADNIEGPWSEPIDLDLPDHIDPDHIVGEDGKRYLFLSSGDMVQLADDGLSTVGEIKHVYDPWHYPDDWDVECFCPEGPKMIRKGDWFYMTTAVGGTAGPPTGHMVISARSKSVHGPWEHAPNNPQVRTASRNDQWWSRGHATPVEGPDGNWYLISHGYENGYWTLGRQALLEPIRWRDDDWWETLGGDLSTPFAIPQSDKPKLPHGMPLSDDFADGLGLQWAYFKPGPDEYDRINVADGKLTLSPSGEYPSDSRPLCFIAGDLAYEVETVIERKPGSRAGLLAFYDDTLYAGLAFDDEGLLFHRYGMERRRNNEIPKNSPKLHIRMKNDRHVLTFYYRTSEDQPWLKMDVQMEVSGYHHNVAYGFLSLRPAIYAAGTGDAIFEKVTHKALNYF